MSSTPAHCAIRAIFIEENEDNLVRFVGNVNFRQRPLPSVGDCIVQDAKKYVGYVQTAYMESYIEFKRIGGLERRLFAQAIKFRVNETYPEVEITIEE